MEEEMFLGLRKTEGVAIQRFKEKFNKDPLRFYHEEIEKLVQQKLLVVDEQFIKLTKKGKMLGNIVFQEFIK